MPVVPLDFRKTRDCLLRIEEAVRERGSAGDKLWLDAFNMLLSDLAKDRAANPGDRVPTDLQRQNQLTSDLKKISAEVTP